MDSPEFALLERDRESALKALPDSSTRLRLFVDTSIALKNWSYDLTTKEAVLFVVFWVTAFSIITFKLVSAAIGEASFRTTLLFNT